MNSEPVLSTETKEHLLRRRFRRQQALTWQVLREGIRVGTPKYLRVRMNCDRDDPLSDCCKVPAFAKEFYFGELGHRCTLAQFPVVAMARQQFRSAISDLNDIFDATRAQTGIVQSGLHRHYGALLQGH